MTARDLGSAKLCSHLSGLALLPAAGLALFGLLGHLCFVFFWPVPAWLLILAFVLATAGLCCCSRPTRTAFSEPPSRLLLLVFGVLLLLLLAYTAWSSMVTPPRSWDGLVSWSLRARALGTPPDLGRSFFSAHEVLAHSRAYPLLQPLVMASLGDLLGANASRLLFPLLFVAIILLLTDSALRLGLRSGYALILGMALAWTPAWFDVGAGGIDSGYGDLFLAYALLVGARGLLLGEGIALFLACLLLPWIKPEGSFYAILFCILLAFSGSRPRLLPAASGLALSLLLWLPLRARLSFAPESLQYLVGPSLLIALVLFHRLLQALPSRSRRAGIITVLVVVLALTSLLARPWLAQSHDLMLRAFLIHLDSLPERLLSLPDLLLGFVASCLTFKSLGFIAPILLVAFLLHLRHEDSRGRLLWWWLGLVLLLFVLAILLSPERDLEHEVRSRLTRLLLQIVPVAWLLVAQVLAPIRPSHAAPSIPAQEEPAPGASGLA